MAQKLPLFIGGEFVASETNEWLPVTESGHTGSARRRAVCDAARGRPRGRQREGSISDLARGADAGARAR